MASVPDSSNRNLELSADEELVRHASNLRINSNRSRVAQAAIAAAERRAAGEYRRAQLLMQEAAQGGFYNPGNPTPFTDEGVDAARQRVWVAEKIHLDLTADDYARPPRNR